MHGAIGCALAATTGFEEKGRAHVDIPLYALRRDREHRPRRVLDTAARGAPGRHEA